MPDVIVRWVDECLERMREDFRSAPSFFFTENDLVCHLFYLLMQKQNLLLATDLGGQRHMLVHTEYPMPFRCDMGDHRFKIKRDDELTSDGKTYRRGHYDMAVLNPSAVKSHMYEDINGQDFKRFKGRVIEGGSESFPIILYGLDFIFKRDMISESGVRSFSKSVYQDCEKIRRSKNPMTSGFEHLNGFMGKGKVLVFVRSPEDERTVEALESILDAEDILLSVGAARE
ncbi:MAG: hypothetical protein ACLFPN_02165 [Methanomassiliicoccales archaeon]